MIEQVKIKHFVKLDNFEHDFKGHHWLLCGKNGICKSTILRFIQVALGNTDVIPPNSEGSGEVFVNKHGQTYQLKVEIKNGKSKVTITGEDGLSDTRRGILASVMGAVSLNVNEFIELSKTEKGRKQQIEVFKSMLPKEVQDELLRLEANVKVAYEERTELSKDVKKKETEIKTNPLDYLIPKELEKFKEVDISATMDDLKKIQVHNKKVEDVVDRMASRSSEISAQSIKLANLMKEVKELEEAIKLNENKQEDAKIWRSQPANKIQDTAPYEELIKNATKSNQDFKDAQKLLADRELLKSMITDHENYTIRIESGRQAILDAVKGMSGDIVPGLTYNEEGLIWNGVLVHPNTHSTGEQLELAMMLKMGENPDLQVMFLEHTESIDENRMNHILDIANKAGWQIIGEEVRKSQNNLTIEIIGQ